MARLISDSGTELLLAAIYRQAREDLEEAFARVVFFRKACEKGRMVSFIKAEGMPLAKEDEKSALWWYSGREWLPKELASMVADMNCYRRYCRECARQAMGEMADEQMVR